MDSPADKSPQPSTVGSPSAQLELGAAAQPGANPAALEGLQHAQQSLRALFNLALIALLLLGGSGSLVLLQHVRQVRREANALRKTVAEFERTGQPQLEAILNKLKDFARAHPDFAPILAKYRPAGDVPGVPTPSATGQPAKVPPPPAKK
ncbi:MAG: hypothetical protein HYY24_23790 [Verrucomicrobia bacterium]|nr:hypothetical protein [Verrucomicrobiota bacterium]